MGSDYFTTTPEMKAPGEMAAAATYGSFQVPVHGSVAPVAVPVQVESSSVQYQEKVEVNLPSIVFFFFFFHECCLLLIYLM